MQFLHYSIQSLLLDKTGFSDSVNQEKHLNATVIETDGINLYVGTSNGCVYHFVIENKEKPEYIIASKHVLLEGKLVKSILLLPQITCVLILCGSVLFFSNFPELSPIFGLHPIKGVVDICQDLDKLGETEMDGSVILTVLTRRKIKRIKIKDSVSLILDIDYPSPIVACQRGFICCVANNLCYELIDFENNIKIPLFPLQGDYSLYYSSQSTSLSNLMPIIASISKSEFVVTTISSNDENFVGLFIDINGCVRGNVVFSGYPIALASEFPFLMALIDNSFIEIHSIIDQTLIQVIQSPFLGSISGIFRTFGHCSILVESLIEKIIMIESTSSKYLINKTINIENKLLDEEMDIAIRLSTIPSKIFLVGVSGVNCLVFNSFLTYVDMFLDLKEIDDTLFSIKKLTEIMAPENIHSERIYHEISYIYQKIGFIYLEKILFDDAIIQFEKSNIDPRLIISLFPVFELDSDGIMVYKGINELICRLIDIDNIISINVSEKFRHDALISEDEIQVSENYRRTLYENALTMLKKYLLKYRQRRGLGSIGTCEKNKQIFKTVDLVLLKLLVYLSPEENLDNLYGLIDSGIECFDDAVRIFEKNGKYFLLSKLYQNIKMQNKVLEIWKNILEGNLHDDDFLDGEKKMRDYLLEVDNDNLFIDYVIWLIEKYPHIGIEFFMSFSSKKTFTFSIDEMANILRFKSKVCFRIYLEFVVSNFSVYNVSLLNELLLIYVNEIISFLEVPLIKDIVKRSIIDYTELRNDNLSYFEYLSTFMIETDKRYKEFVLNRTKFVQLLQSAFDYDSELLLKSLHSHKDLLLIELVILYGRSLKHEEALAILVQTLKDYKTSEIYCYRRGLSLELCYDNQEAQDFFLQRKSFFKMLLDQYLKLSDYNERFFRISFLLRRWGSYLDVIYVLKVISNDWSVEKISGFLFHIFQKTIQEKYETQLIKSLHRGCCAFYDYSNIVTFIDKSS
ncbi:hypothetical protein PMAC_001387 [Pneumocystis sp. 'macacae']|nr:hypothetical protein PMAC_001387 [Pneumocystis sp. 'macacae']